MYVSMDTKTLPIQDTKRIVRSGAPLVTEKQTVND